MSEAVPFSLLHAWVEGRSLARGVPTPVSEHGGCRVDTGTAEETCRWIFPGIVPGIAEVARAFARPDYLIKACVPCEELARALPAGWRVEPTGHVMRATRRPMPAAIPAGYAISVERAGRVIAVRIATVAGEHAAGGYAAATDRAFVYDRIVTAPAHRRKGLGHAVMAALGDHHREETPGLLVATEAGRALYEPLGWVVLAPYATGSVAR